MRADLILAAAAMALEEQFEGRVGVYIEQEPEGAQESYLLIRERYWSQRPEDALHDRRLTRLEIGYHAQGQAGQSAMREQLAEALAWIAPDGSPLRAAAMRADTKTGMLRFFADYNMRVLRKENTTIMQMLTYQQQFKEE